MTEHGIKPIDLVAVNLYPFEATINKPGCDLPTAIENIDIGGPTMVRSAAKNHKDVAIVVNAGDYARVLESLKAGGLTYAQRFDLMLKAFEHTAAYDGMIANYMGTVNQAAETLSTEGRSQFPRTFNSQFIKAQEMRYGENPHQSAAFYVEAKPAEVGIATATQLQGKELSVQQRGRHRRRAGMREELRQAGLRDRQARQPVWRGREPGRRRRHPQGLRPGLRHRHRIGLRRHHRLQPRAGRRDRQGHRRASVRRSRSSPLASAKKPAPSWPPKPTCVCWPAASGRLTAPAAWDYKRVNGGLLVQSRDIGMISADDLKVVTKRAPTEQEIHDLIFAWKVAKYVKSNAIVYAKNRQTIGVGAGQMSRVNSARIAAIKAEHAGLQVAGSVMASDAFFPFRDGIDNAAKAGITAVIQPGGSMRDARGDRRC